MYKGKFASEPTPENNTPPVETPPETRSTPVRRAPQRRRPPARRAPQRQRTASARAPQRKKEITTGTFVFYIIYLVLVLALFIGITVAMGALKDWIPTILPADQSATLSQAVFDEFFADPDWALLYKTSYPNASDAEVAEYVKKIEAFVGNKKLAFCSTSAGMSDDKKYAVYVDGIGVASFTLTPDDPNSTNPVWSFTGIQVEQFPAEVVTPPKVTYLCYNIITQPDNTVTVNGRELTDADLIRSVTTAAEEYLPEGLHGYRLSEYRVVGLKAAPEVVITDADGQIVETAYDEATKTYSQVMPESPTISAEDAEYQVILNAAKAWTKYTVTGSRTDLATYYYTNSQVYKDIISGEMFRQDYESYSYKPETVTEYYRYSDTLFSAKIKLDCVVIPKNNGQEKLYTVDSTYLFEWTGSKWMVYDLTNIEIQQQTEKVRLTFMDAEGNAIKNTMVDSSVKFLSTPVLEAPEGKVFDGWYAQSFDEEGGEYLNKVFTPDATGTVNLTGNTETLKSMVLVPYFVDAQEAA